MSVYWKEILISIKHNLTFYNLMNVEINEIQHKTLFYTVQ